MNARNLLISLLRAVFTASASAQNNFERDTIETSRGELVITFIGHGTLMFGFDDMVI